MLSLEEQIIDATTEEGQQALREFEESERAERKAAAAAEKKAETTAQGGTSDPE
jgi:cell division cycle protein 37